jgi:hypothetical protein
VSGDKVRSFHKFPILSCSIKEKLRTGEMHVRGDQWLYFLYADLAYDPDDPWNGLLRNQLLVYVSIMLLLLLLPWIIVLL